MSKEIVRSEHHRGYEDRGALRAHQECLYHPETLEKSALPATRTEDAIIDAFDVLDAAGNRFMNRARARLAPN
jgi:hypothetical protein